jgi:competence protein ComEC
VSASYGFVLIWLSGSILLFAVTILIRKSNRLLQVSTWLSVILLLTGILSYQVSVRDVTRLAVLDVGNAQSVVLTRNGHAAVVGCGGFSSNPIGSYLRSQGITKLDYIQPLTQGKEESKNCAELTQTFRPEHLVMKKSDYLDDFLQKAIPGIKAVSSFQEQSESKLWNNAELLTASSGQASAARITVNQITVLVCPDGVEYTTLPPDWLSSDFLITGTVPNRTTPLEPFYTVLTVDEEGLQKNYALARPLHPLATAGRGNIVLELKDDRTLKIRRE